MDGFQFVKRGKQKRKPNAKILSKQSKESPLVEEFDVERCKKKIIECRFGLQSSSSKSTIETPEKCSKSVQS